MCGPLSVAYMTNVLSAISASSIAYATYVFIMIDHRIMVYALPTTRLALAFRLDVSSKSHVCKIKLDENG